VGTGSVALTSFKEKIVPYTNNMNDSASFYNPSFSEGMPRLAGVNCNNVKYNACSHSGQAPCWGSQDEPMSMTYPNDINSWMFRKTEGYGIMPSETYEQARTKGKGNGTVYSLTDLGGGGTRQQPCFQGGAGAQFCSFQGQQPLAGSAACNRCIQCFADKCTPQTAGVYDASDNLIGYTISCVACAELGTAPVSVTKSFSQAKIGPGGNPNCACFSNQCCTQKRALFCYNHCKEKGGVATATRCGGEGGAHGFRVGCTYKF
jgi:hypothetical protein